MDSQTSPYCTDSGHAFDDCFGISCIWCKIIIDPGALAPNGHPYITSTKLIEKIRLQVYGRDRYYTEPR